MKTIIPLLFIILSFTSCLKTKQDNLKPIIDYRTFGTVNVWDEVNKRTVDIGWEPTSNAGWETLSNRNSLTLFLNSMNDSAKIGIYMYDPANLGIDIDSTGDVLVNDNEMIFLNFANGNIDTLATIHYDLKGDTTLILRNTTATPIIELKFKHRLTRKNVRH